MFACMDHKISLPVDDHRKRNQVVLDVKEDEQDLDNALNQMCETTLDYIYNNWKPEYFNYKLWKKSRLEPRGNWLNSSRFQAFSKQYKPKFDKFMKRFSRVGVYPLEDVLRAKTQTQTLPTALLSDDSVFERHQNFKQFDTVVDFSDHLFSTKPKEQASEVWDANIHKEFKILEENLPETIFVRAYESRKDLLRAVIIGPKGTPYHDGLFFFDMYFPPKFPLYPPVMRYHSSGFGMNPHLFESGEVCLNLYKVWSPPDEPLWRVCETTVLQLLISIQDRVLNADPLLLQPGMLENGPSVAPEYFSLLYNEDILIKSLKSMVYIMNKPPKNFEAFVLGHFRDRVVDILMACRGYIEGVLKVGANKEGCCSHEFQSNVSECVYRFSLLNVFISIRASKLSIPYPANGSFPSVSEYFNLHKPPVADDRGGKKMKLSQAHSPNSAIAREPLRSNKPNAADHRESFNNTRPNWSGFKNLFKR